MDWSTVERGISEALEQRFVVQGASPVSGGCINQAYVLEGTERQVFVKRNQEHLLPMFEAEAMGLEELGNCGAIRVPQVIAKGRDDGGSWLALEYIEMGSPSPTCSSELGSALANLHRHCARQFGWHRDNFIGETEQVNTWTAEWPEFFARYRLRWQLDLAKTNGAGTYLLDAGYRLASQLHQFFDSYQPLPSLLHGDLWGGNWATSSSGEPVIFDPAVYYGDRETDLAMTELFGGFDDRFYHSYRDHWDIDPGYTTRKVLYKLYHVLNHFNLFGGSYARQAQDMIDTLNAEVG